MSGDSSARVASASVETDMLWRLYVFAHIIMICQCEDILCIEMELLSPKKVVRGMDLLNGGNQVIIEL